MKTTLRGMIIVAMALILVAPAFARGEQEVDFLAEFEGALEDEGFTEEEAQAVAEAARSHDWSDARASDPELIAAGIARAREEGAELSPEKNAELALELAENAVALREEGYESSEVAQATLQAVTELQEQIRTWQDGDQEQPLGEIVRDTVSETAREAARERTAASGRDEAESGQENVPEEADERAGSAGAGNR